MGAETVWRHHGAGKQLRADAQVVLHEVLCAMGTGTTLTLTRGGGRKAREAMKLILMPAVTQAKETRAPSKG